MSWIEYTPTYEERRNSVCGAAARELQFPPEANVVPLWQLYDELLAAKGSVHADEIVDVYRAHLQAVT